MGPIMVRYKNQSSYLFVEISESYSLNSIISAIHEIDEYCRKENLNKVLIDIRGLEGNPSIFDRYQIGVEIAKTWGGRLKVAVVAEAKLITRMTENTAINRGAKMWGTPDMDAALQWLEIKFHDETAGA